MSDEEYFDESEESEEGTDFSPSEDDWKPGKDDGSDEDDYEIDVGSDDDNKKRKTTKSTVKAKVVTKKLSSSKSRNARTSLRSKMSRRYNIAQPNAAKSPLQSNVTSILSSSQYKNPKQLPSTSSSNQATVSNDSDSDSSEDEGLVNPNEIDFNSDFFNVKPKSPVAEEQNNVPSFDCNAGMHLSDSSDDEAEANEATEKEQDSTKPSIIEQINKKSSTEMHDFSGLQNFAKNLESAKAHLQKLNEKEANTSKSNNVDDVSKLLCLGEGANVSAVTPTRKRKHKDGQHSDGSDWENVSDEDERKPSEIKDIQITVGNAAVRGMSREQKRAIDLEACLKRRMNRDIKERQVFLHKTAVLCWIAHGNYINRVLNNLQLMEMCIKRLPSKNAYPKGDTDLKYFAMVTTWFHSVFTLKSDSMFCQLSKMPPKVLSLALQIQSKKVVCKYDFVLLFVTMLRSLGIQCRLVMNFAGHPLKPPQKDLLVVSSKPKENSKTAEESEKPKTAAKVKKVSTEKTSTKASTSKSSDKTIAVKSKASSKSSDAKAIPAKKPKVNLSRMSPSFMAQNMGEPSTSQHLKSTPPAPSTKSPTISSKLKKTTSKDTHDKTPTSPPIIKKLSTKKTENVVDDKKKRTKAATAASSQTLVGTPTKHNLYERKNGVDPKVKAMSAKVDVAVAFSPRKTRSRTTKKTDDATTTNQQKLKTKLKLPQLDGADDLPSNKKNAKTKSKPKSKPRDDESSGDSDFQPSPPKRIRPKTIAQKLPKNPIDKAKAIDRRVFSTDEEQDDDAFDSNMNKMNFWVEAYAEKEKKWVIIDPVNKKVDNIDYVKKHTAKPTIYVFAWNNDNTIRDVTPRYCSQFHTTTRKQRADQLWLDDTLDALLEHTNPRTIIEDIEFSKLQMDTPMPTSINEFKNHPLYALERHLLKFEGIYPPNALILGYIRKEPVYSRDCVHTMHSREIWVKQARTVKIGETPYKIVKARPKWNRQLNQMEEAKPLEIFGFWQTEPYQPPVAENGIVPRNPYGNVELFKPEMLPIGTRHIQLPNLNRVCKKMRVDCAQAVIGFDFHGGSSHPTFDGFVVCEEFADDVIKQWEIEQEEQIRKEAEKREARVYGNWKKLIKGLFIRERLKRKFQFGVDEKASSSSRGGKRKKE